MNALVAGHKYQLDSFDGTVHQELQFIQKGDVGGIFETITDGTTNEEVLGMMIDRLKFLQEKLPCIENKNAIMLLELALEELELRTVRRRQQLVEGTSKPHAD